MLCQVIEMLLQMIMQFFCAGDWKFRLQTWNVNVFNTRKSFKIICTFFLFLFFNVRFLCTSRFRIVLSFEILLVFFLSSSGEFLSTNFRSNMYMIHMNEKKRNKNVLLEVIGWVGRRRLKFIDTISIELD